VNVDLDAVIRDLQRRRGVLDEAIAVFERLVEEEKVEKGKKVGGTGPRKKAKPTRKRTSSD
jgi:hypothetical protein